MDEIITILRTDEGLWTLFGSATPRLYPGGHDGIEECITYSFYNNQDNAVKAVDTFNITVICYSIGKAQQALERIKELILTKGADPLTLKVLNVAQNGGGYLQNKVGDKTMHHFRANFIVTRRK